MRMAVKVDDFLVTGVSGGSGGAWVVVVVVEVCTGELVEYTYSSGGDKR